MNKLKNVFFDLLVPYKNFIWWNISKLMIFLVSFFIAILSIFFFIIIAYFISFYDKINWSSIYQNLLNTNSWINKDILNLFFL